VLVAVTDVSELESAYAKLKADTNTVVRTSRDMRTLFKFLFFFIVFSFAWFKGW
jgi:hypothetical protein